MPATSRPATGKKQYKKPTLVTHGGVEALTQGHSRHEHEERRKAPPSHILPARRR